MLRNLTASILCIFLLAATTFPVIAQQRQVPQEPPISLAQPSPDQQAILAGVGNVQISADFSPGAVCFFGDSVAGRTGTPGSKAADSAFPILLGQAGEASGRNRAPMIPLAAASQYEKGRVVIFGHSGLISGAFFDDNGGNNSTLCVNLISWLARKSNNDETKPLNAIRVAVVDEQGTTEFLKTQGIQADLIRAFSDEAVSDQYDVLIYGAERIRGDQIAIIDQFVKNGGGLMSAATGWGWQQLNPTGDLKTTFAGNQLVAKMGLAWSDQFAGRIRNGYVPAVGVSKFLHPRVALDAIFDEQSGTTLSNNDWTQLVATLELTLGSIPDEQAVTFSALQELITRQVIPTKQKPIIAAEQPLDRLAMLMQTQRYMTVQAKSGLPEGLVIPKFEAAAEFPGDVPEGAARVNRKVEIDTSIPDWHSTGLYAAPGDVITITIPLEVAARNGKLGVRIGALTDRLWHLPRWERYPEISLTAQLGQTVTQVVNPFGGHVYIVVPRNMPAESISVQIDGAVEAPYYVFGTTTDEQWQTSRQAPGPWAELASDRVTITVPSHLVRELDNPKELMEFWNAVLDADAELVGWPQKRVRPERITADRQISAGWMHSGYPVMTPTQTERGLTDLAYLHERGDRWGFFHEFGHNHQSGDWTFSGTGEVTVNLFTLYNFEHQCNTPIVEARRDFLPEARKATKEKYIAAGASFDQWKSDPFLALGMYVELIDEFGWESFKKVFAEYRNLSPNERPRNDDEKRDQWMCRFSKQVGKNLGPFFDQWGVPVSQSAKESIKDLPVWLPTE